MILTRKSARNGLAAMPSIDPEIGVGGQQDWIVARFGHSHEAGVREAHWDIGIFVEQFEHGICVVAKTEGTCDGTATNELGQIFVSTRAEQVEGLR